MHDVINILESFKEQNSVSLGQDTYKVRFQSSDMPKGKNKSFRLIVLIMKIESLITPIVIFYKGDRDNITRKDIRYHIDRIQQELKP